MIIIIILFSVTETLQTKSRKRQLWLPDTSLDGDDRDLSLIEAAGNLEDETSKKKITDKNELWNDVHCNLVRELEKLGTLQRYGHKHLKLWTDLIIEGKSGGVGEEPAWEKYIDVVGVPPKRRSLDKTVTQPAQPADKCDDQLLKTLLIQNSTMMAMMSSNMCMMQQVHKNMYITFLIAAI